MRGKLRQQFEKDVGVDLPYSYAAIIRGLIALGLASIAGKESLAVEFAGARVPLGRKRRSPWKQSDDSGG